MYYCIIILNTNINILYFKYNARKKKIRKMSYDNNNVKMNIPTRNSSYIPILQSVKRTCNLFESSELLNHSLILKSHIKMNKSSDKPINHKRVEKT